MSENQPSVRKTQRPRTKPVDATNQVASRKQNRLRTRMASHQAVIQKKSSSQHPLDIKIVAGRKALLAKDLAELEQVKRREPR